jgi:nucleoside-triphosphatase THEP1
MSVEITLISNAITNYIQRSYQLDAVLLQLISTAVINSLNFFSDKIRKVRLDAYIDTQLEHVDSTAVTLFVRKIYYSCMLAVVVYIIWRFKLLQKFWYFVCQYFHNGKATTEAKTVELISQDKSDKKYYEIEVSNIHTTLTNVNKFINLHPEFFDTHVNQRIIKFTEDEYYPIYNSRVCFDDKIHNVDGYITTSFSSLKDSNNQEIKDYKMILHIYKFASDKKCYVKQINDYINYQTKHGNQVKLTYYKVLAKSIVSHAFYEESLDKWYADTKLLKDTFFSPHKEYLFSIMEQKLAGNTMYANSWNNLLLYGKPGVGKSTFIYRIATLLRLSIISVDLSLYIDKKKELYALFHGQEFALPGSDTKQNTSKNCVIVLEEFDNCVEKLLELENIHKYKKLLVKEQIARRQGSLQKEIKNVSKNISKIADKETFHKTDQPLTTDFQRNFRNFAQQSLAFSDDEENDPLDNSNNTAKNITKAAVDLDKIIRTTNEENMSDVLRLSDLLELMQGPVPIKDRIIIATTNHLDHIIDALPALCRPGRLTPLEFCYLDWNSLNELCRFYFQQEISGDPFPITIPTSQVVELAVKHVTTKGSFDDFKNELVSIVPRAVGRY